MSEPVLSQKFLSYGKLPGWLDELAEKAVVYAPRAEGQSVGYRPRKPGEVPELAARPVESAKQVIFPRCEELFTFRRESEPENPGVRKLTLQEAADPEPAIVFGALPCDARGFSAFDPVYNGCGTNGAARDVYYLKRRAQTAFIVKACKTALSTCFCHWTGGGPADPQGADVLATEVEGGLLLQALTEKGADLVRTGSLPDATGEQVREAGQSHEEALRNMGEAPDLAGAPEALLDLFGNQDFWRQQSAGCLSCGVCTYLCPTCYCFNITDESNGVAGTRLRTWDTCMSPLFTLEASGHNPRQEKAARLKNRVGHKFSYYPSLHGGRFSCCGCGRCIKSCPSSVDIRKIVLNAVKENAHV